jgi:RHS repeat-associated protein
LLGDAALDAPAHRVVGEGGGLGGSSACASALAAMRDSIDPFRGRIVSSMKLTKQKFTLRHRGKRRCAGRRTAKTATFSYDAMGRRIQSSITKQGQSTATVQYLYEGQQALGEIRDGKLSHRLLAGLGLDETIARIAIAAIAAIAAKDPAASRIFLTDALNSVIAQMSDADEPTLQTSYGYSPYGQSTTVGTDSTNNPIQYTSRENDGTGLFYYRARYYDPVLKRFVSEDPIGLAGGWF